jgi:hypothetical protein
VKRRQFLQRSASLAALAGIDYQKDPFDRDRPVPIVDLGTAIRE